ncbi:hypothetical protein J18TS1_16940 [Oceanobacillus oncorhynchi subsp. incaldanensis]|nr:hypothetical protein J18TS1_16940 [Oceanobacillus oncorhynchi subsp. incaldanensis]
MPTMLKTPTINIDPKSAPAGIFNLTPIMPPKYARNKKTIAFILLSLFIRKLYSFCLIYQE